MLYSLNLYSTVCQLYLNKSERKNKAKKKKKRVAGPKSSWKQAASLRRQVRPAHGEASMPGAENILQEEKGLKNIQLHPY